MSVRERIMICRVVEKIEVQEGYSKKLGIENASTFHGKPVSRTAKRTRETRGWRE